MKKDADDRSRDTCSSTARRILSSSVEPLTILPAAARNASAVSWISDCSANIDRYDRKRDNPDSAKSFFVTVVSSLPSRCLLSHHGSAICGCMERMNESGLIALETFARAVSTASVGREMIRQSSMFSILSEVSQSQGEETKMSGVNNILNLSHRHGPIRSNRFP